MMYIPENLPWILESLSLGVLLFVSWILFFLLSLYLLSESNSFPCNRSSAVLKINSYFSEISNLNILNPRWFGTRELVKGKGHNISLTNSHCRTNTDASDDLSDQLLISRQLINYRRFLSDTLLIKKRAQRGNP